MQPVELASVSVCSCNICVAHCRTQVQLLCVTEDLNADGGVCMQCARSNMGSSSKHLMQVGMQEAGVAASLLECSFVHCPNPL